MVLLLDQKYAKVSNYTFTDEAIFDDVRREGGVLVMEFVTNTPSINSKTGRRKINNIIYIRNAIESRVQEAEKHFGIAYVRNSSGICVPTDFSAHVVYDNKTLRDALSGERKPYPYEDVAEEVEEYLSNLLSFLRHDKIEFNDFFHSEFKNTKLQSRVSKHLGEKRVRRLHHQATGYVHELYMDLIMDRCNGFCKHSINNLIETDERIGPDIDYVMALKSKDIQRFLSNLRRYKGITLRQ